MFILTKSKARASKFDDWGWANLAAITIDKSKFGATFVIQENERRALSTQTSYLVRVTRNDESYYLKVKTDSLPLEDFEIPLIPEEEEQT